MKSILKIIASIISISFILTFTLIASFIYSSIKDVQHPKLEEIVYNNITTIYDKNEEMILLLGEDKNNEVSFDDLPDVFVDALISAEDSKFILHNGIDPTRLVSAALSNIKNKSFSQGGSTLTQQLAKNLFLTNEKTLERKLKEAYISIELEKSMSKEEIFTTYVNRIYFDGSTIGVNNASLKFFSKNIKDVTLPEAATLAGMVNAPTLYNPIKNPDNANIRKNKILDLMVRHGYITAKEAKIAKSIHVESLIKQEKMPLPTYNYQAYLDVVYAEVIELTGLDPFLTPMKIYTNIDISTQNIIDNIQNGEDKAIVFEDDNQQFATAVVENNTGKIIAIGGGRNYIGQRLYNRAYNMKQQPASTIKPLIYALAIEELGWNNNQLLLDQPFVYPGTDKEVKNADKTHMGELLLKEALGYSRNTTALYTMEELIDTVGLNRIYTYLQSLNMMDTTRNNFNLSYGIGGYLYGVSPIDLAGAYSMIASNGIYKKPTTINKIILYDGTIIKPSYEEKEIIDESSAFLISKTLEDVVTDNYWGIGTLSIKNTSIAAKTGTSSYDSSIHQKYNYPTNASKDIWVAGYSPSYTISVWTGFDEPTLGEKNYFDASGDTRVKISKKIFSRLMNYLSSIPSKFETPESVEKVNVVKGTNLLPDEYTPSSMIIESYYKKENIPTEHIYPIELEQPDELNYIIDNQYLILEAPKKERVTGRIIFSYEKVYGSIKTVYKIKDPLGNVEYIDMDDTEVLYELKNEGEYIIEAYNMYSKVDTLISPSITSSFYYINEKEEKDNIFSFPFNFI